ncbi:MAG: tRNA-guanine transglycosylase DpdA [Deltaproteobacteria bacterium]|jgi:hypothetical protein|nr:tRNA-guanine transglycosylase DpdA [Deltaproteobacteria bacterium]
MNLLEGEGPLYFIPDWDDYVDPGYDFKKDVQQNKGWENSVYAHEIYSQPPYDGILVSKVVEEKSKIRRQRIRKYGIHKALRVNPDFPVIGDCGAFGYFKEKTPPYSTSEILDYYSSGGFNFGVSIDHLIPSKKFADKEFRYRITLENGKKFIKAHRKKGLRWIPVGAVQGWNPETYALGVREYVKLGYELIALGGLVRTSTREIIAILEEVNKVDLQGARLHLFGVARNKILPLLKKSSVFSVDSASALRRAWMGSKDNYHTLDQDYCAIRVPVPGKRGPMKKFKGKILARAQELEKKSLHHLRGYASGGVSLQKTLAVVEDYESLYLGEKKSNIANYEKTLKDRPWEKCQCKICKNIGIEVVIFRGNNRNRRRGFHNTWVLNQRFKVIRK